jgi:mRNA interferase RelE/StbE
MTDTVTIPRAEYEALKARSEDLDDIIAGHAAMTGATLPHDYAMRIINGESPVRVWRDYRGMSAAALADSSKVSRAYLSEIETGKKPGSVEAYKSLSAILRVPIEALVD